MQLLLLRTLSGHSNRGGCFDYSEHLGAPVNPVLLAMAVIAFIAGLALRDTIPNYFFRHAIVLGTTNQAG
jgi:hypothetical protein